MDHVSADISQLLGEELERTCSSEKIKKSEFVVKYISNWPVKTARKK